MVASCLQEIELWYPSFGLQVLIVISLFYTATAASQWRIAEIQLVASVGWKRGCQPFGCRCSQHVTTCLSKEFIPTIPFGIPSIHSLPEASGSRERHAPPAVHYCTMPLPSLQLKKRTCLLQSTDRATMWLRETKLLASFSCRCWQNVMHRWKEIYATCLWQESIPAIAFGSGCWQNVMHCRKEIYAYLCDMFV